MCPPRLPALGRPPRRRPGPVRPVRLRLRRRRAVRVRARPSRACPFGAHVASYPVQESDGLVWVWLGESGRARLHRVPELPWLDDDGWAGVGGTVEVAAGFLLLHENFADVTQVPFVAPEIAPAALAATPPLEVVVTETTVELRREFPPAPLPGWQAEMLGTEIGDATTVQGGFFLSPAVWTDHWDATYDGGSARLRFTQLVTPVDGRLEPAALAGQPRLRARRRRGGRPDGDAVRGLLRAGADGDGDRPAACSTSTDPGPRSTSPPTSPPCGCARSCSTCWPRRASPSRPTTPPRDPDRPPHDRPQEHPCPS